MRRLIALAALLTLTACGGGSDGSNSEASEPSTTPTTTATAATTPAEEVETVPPCALDSGSVFLLLRSWDRVAASVGAPDDAEQAQSFVDDLEEFEDRDTANCSEVESEEFALLGLKAAQLNAQTSLGDVSDDEVQEVVDAGDDWLDLIGYDDGSFSDSSSRNS